MALEAVSRGAKKAVLVDKDREAVRVIRKNIAALRFEEACAVLPMQDTAALDRLAEAGERFDIIFLDPPYRMDTNPVIASILEKWLLSANGVLCVEYDRIAPDAARGLSLWKERAIGQTRLRLFRREE